MIGLILLYVGAVLFINGLTLLGRVAPREAAIMNIFTGLLSVAVCLHVGFTSEADGSIQFCAYGLLFAMTYLWSAYNSLTHQDGRGLGWFSLFVSITALAIASDQLYVSGFWNHWLLYCWGSWSALWFAYFFLGVFKPHVWASYIVGALTLVVAVMSAWIPGYLVLSGHMPQ